MENNKLKLSIKTLQNIFSDTIPFDIEKIIDMSCH